MNSPNSLNSVKLLPRHRFVMIARLGSPTPQVRTNTQFAGMREWCEGRELGAFD
jgi:hypothetical protein